MIKTHKHTADVQKKGWARPAGRTSAFGRIGSAPSPSTAFTIITFNGSAIAPVPGLLETCPKFRLFRKVSGKFLADGFNGSTSLLCQTYKMTSMRWVGWKCRPVLMVLLLRFRDRARKSRAHGEEIFKCSYHHSVLAHALLARRPSRPRKGQVRSLPSPSGARSFNAQSSHPASSVTDGWQNLASAPLARWHGLSTHWLNGQGPRDPHKSRRFLPTERGAGVFRFFCKNTNCL
jgi:hypothetical protein